MIQVHAPTTPANRNALTSCHIGVIDSVLHLTSERRAPLCMPQNHKSTTSPWMWVLLGMLICFLVTNTVNVPVSL